MFDNIPFPTIFVCFLIFAAWMHYEKRKSSRLQEQKSREFWQREEEANHTRNKDISKLPFFTPDITHIPMTQTEDENVAYYQDKVRGSLGLPMMNLSEYTNTDLKLAYGTGNFKTLSDYDENFNTFLMNLSNLGKAYCRAGYHQEAADVYRFCLDSGSAKSTDYKALADAYAALGETSEIRSLIREVEASELPRKDAVAENLRTLV